MFSERLTIKLTILLSLLFCVGTAFVFPAVAQPSPTINYQGKLTDSAGLAVPDGTYNMRFWLLQSTSQATTSAVWTESLTSADQVQVTNGLFSVMLGSTTALTSVDFNQPLYLGVEIGGTGGTPSWDGEMSPRKPLGTVPAAFEAFQLGGVASSSFLRSDEADTMDAFLTMTSGASTSDLIISGTATTTNFVINNQLFSSLTGAGLTVSGGALTANISESELNITGSPSDGYVLQASSTATSGFIWQATSTLGIDTSADDLSDNSLHDLSDVAAMTEDFGDLLYWNGSAWADIATSSLNVALSDTTGTLGVTRGGTGLTTVTTGDLLYADGSDSMAALAAGASGSVLQISGGAPAWTATSSLGLGDGSFLGLSDTPSSFTTNAIAYVSGSALSFDSTFTYDGTSLGLGTGSPGAMLDIFGTSNSLRLSYDVSNYTELTVDSAGQLSISSSNGGASNIELGSGIAEDLALLLNGNGTDWYAGLDDTDDLFKIGTGNEMGTSTLFQISSATTTFNTALAVTSSATSTFTDALQATCFTTDGANCLTQGAFTSAGGVTYLNNESDNVGIGTSTPNARLTIVGADGSSNPLFRVASSTDFSTGNIDGAWLAVDETGLTKIAGKVFNPTKVGGTATGDSAYGLAVQGDYAYVTNLSTATHEFEIFDISDPVNPTKVGGAAAASHALDVSVQGSYAYVVSDVTGDDLEIFDISDPTNPVKVGGAAAASTVYDIEVSGKYAYLVSYNVGGDDDLEIFDISDPTNPVKVGGVAAADDAYGVAVTGGYAYVVSDVTGDDLEIFDISDPTNPVKVGGVSATNVANAVVVSGGYAYVGTNSSFGNGGLDVFDISDPALPVKVVTVGAASNVNDLTVAGRYLYVSTDANAGNELEIFDISSSTNPIKIAGAETADDAESVVVAGNYVYIVSQSTGDDLEIFDIGGVEISNTEIGSAKIDSLQVSQTAIFDQSINVKTGLNVGRDALIGGQLSITGNSSTTLTTNLAQLVLGGNTARDSYLSFKSGVNKVWSMGLDQTGSAFRISSSSSLGTNDYFSILADGNVGIGTSSPLARLSIDRSAFSGAGVVGLDQYLQTENSVDAAVQYGNSFYLNASNTATTTLVGSVYRVKDSTAFGNTVRGLEVQTNKGINTEGENTALSGFARTFGVRGYSSGDAGGTFEPAGGFFETGGTTQGNAMRGYSGSITTATLLSLFQDTSAFTGTGLEMNFGNTTGSFSSSTSKYLDFQNGGTSVFTVSAYGTTTIGDGTTNNMAGLQIGYGGICVDNDGSCVASTTGQVAAVSYYTGNSDLAEMYFSSTELEAGEVVTLAGGLSIDRAERDSDTPVLGVVSTKPGMTLGYDDTSLAEDEKAFPIALSGRVPVKLSTENGPIKKGDQLMLSSLSGVAMKATGTGVTIGVALEDFDESRMYSDTYLNQFGDDMVEPVYEPILQNTDPRIDDGCYYGGGKAAGEEPCVPLVSTTTDGQLEEANQLAEEDSIEEQLEALREEESETKSLADGRAVQVGQIVMFVERGYRWIDDSQLAALGVLMSTSSIEIVGENKNETIFDRLVALANSFVDGVLSIFELRVDRVEVAKEICIDDVCVNANDLRAMIADTEAVSSLDGGITDPVTDTDIDTGSGDEAGDEDLEDSETGTGDEDSGTGADTDSGDDSTASTTDDGSDGTASSTEDGTNDASNETDGDTATTSADETDEVGGEENDGGGDTTDGTEVESDEGQPEEGEEGEVDVEGTEPPPAEDSGPNETEGLNEPEPNQTTTEDPPPDSPADETPSEEEEEVIEINN